MAFAFKLLSLIRTGLFCRPFDRISITGLTAALSEPASSFPSRANLVRLRRYEGAVFLLADVFVCAAALSMSRMPEHIEKTKERIVTSETIGCFHFLFIGRLREVSINFLLTTARSLGPAIAPPMPVRLVLKLRRFT